MTRIPVHTKRSRPSGRVAGAIIPTDIASPVSRVVNVQGIADESGLINLGRGVGNLGQAIGAIDIAKGEGEAAVARSKSASIIKQMNEQLSLTNNTELYDGIRDDAYKKINALRPESKVGAARFDDFLELSQEDWSAGVEMLRRRKDLGNMQIDYEQQRAVQIAEGNLEEADALTEAAVNKSGIITQKQAAADFVQNRTETAKVIKAKQISAATGLAFDAWQATTEDDPDGNLRAALDAVEASGIDDADKQEVESEVKSRIENRRAQNKIEREERHEEQRGDINEAMYISKDYVTSRDLILNSGLDQKEKRALLKENEDRSKLVNQGFNEIDDVAAMDAISTAIAQVGDGNLALIEAKKIFYENKSKLKSTTAASFMEEINKSFNASTDGAFANVRGSVRQFAVGKSEGALEILAKAIFDPDAPKDAKERLKTAREKFDAELRNFLSWEESIKAWRRDNPDASPVEIEKEGLRMWFTDFADKTQAQKNVEEEINEVGTKEEGKEKTASDIIKQVGVGAAKETPERILVESPEGVKYFIRADQLERALKSGWKRL